MRKEENIEKEGHTREWQDRARVVIDAKEAAKTEASPKQSPVSEDDAEEVNRKDGENAAEESNQRDAVY